jgi:hypothetical protein
MPSAQGGSEPTPMSAIHPVDAVPMEGLAIAVHRGQDAGRDRRFEKDSSWVWRINDGGSAKEHQFRGTHASQKRPETPT